MGSREIAARIAIEWPYTVEQVQMVVDAASGSESVARAALVDTRGLSSSHIWLACIYAKCPGGVRPSWLDIPDARK